MSRLQVFVWVSLGSAIAIDKCPQIETLPGMIWAVGIALGAHWVLEA